MIVLDTNVVSEPLRSSASPTVLAWLDEQRVETLFLTTISLAELRYGIAAMPDGRRRDGLKAALENTILDFFGPRILPFDTNAASAYAVLRARATASGLAIGPTDGYIAAIAAARGFSVATRDVRPFEAAGITVINPWHAG